MKFNGGEVWHSGTLTPSDYLPKNGSVAMTGNLTIDSSWIKTKAISNTSTYHEMVRSDDTVAARTRWIASDNSVRLEALNTSGNTIVSALTLSGDSASIKFNGGDVWHSGNFTPSSKADVSSLTNYWAKNEVIQVVGVNSSIANGTDTASLRISNATSGATGDTNVAAMSFLCQGNYGIKLHLRADGYFGLGGYSRGTWSWYSDPSGNMVAAGNITAYSDPRLKDDISKIENPLDIVDQLDGVRFTWNHKTKLIGKPGQRDIGLLADQVNNVLPELVTKSIPDEENDGTEWLTVAYDKLIPVLVESIKELRREIESLK